MTLRGVLFSLLMTFGALSQASLRCEAVFEYQIVSQSFTKTVTNELRNLWDATAGSLLFQEDQVLSKVSHYSVTPEKLGIGYTAVVYRGHLPRDFKNSFASSDPNWIGGVTEVAIKVPKNDSSHLHSAMAEYKMSQYLESFDTKDYFTKYYLDKTENILVSTLQADFMTLETWLEKGTPGLSPKTFLTLESELGEVLSTLERARLVHSDLGLQNILINPKTFKIKVIDYGIMARTEDYPETRAALLWNRRGGRFKSPNQRRDRPAILADDAYALQKTLQIIRNELKEAPHISVIRAQGGMIQLAPSSPEWLFLTTRNGKAFDSGFPQRLHDSMEYIFEPYVDAFLAGNELGFTQMLRNQHRILAAGVDNKNRYFGASMGIWNYVLHNVAIPGFFRNEEFNGPSFSRWRLTISITDTLGGHAPTDKLGIVDPVLISGIPSEFLPTRVVSQDNVRYVHAPESSVPVYLEKMKMSMESALTKLRNGAPKETLLSDLADYLQYGLAGHIFSVGNYSLYMTQVNGVLRRIGYSGVSPSYLDYHALVEDSSEFRKRFIREVESHGALKM